MKDNLGSPKLRMLEVLALVASLAIVTIVAGLPLLVVNLQADDLCRSVRLSHTGILNCVEQDYLTFTGRWCGFGLEYAALSLVQSSPAYGMILGAIALVYFGAVTYLLRALFPQLGFQRQLFIAATLFAIYWVGLPSTKDSCYWLCGSVEYQLSLACASITCASTIAAANRNADKRRYRFLWWVAILTAIVCPGLHELFGLMLCIILVAGTFMAWKWRIAGKYIWLGVTCCAMGGFLFAFLAPGNAMRSENLEHSRDLFAAAKVAISTILQSLPDWIFNFRLIVTTVLLIACVPKLLETNSWLTDERKKLLRWAIPVVWIVLLAGSFFGPAWGTGQVIASRTLAATYMIFLLGWFLTWLMIVAWLQTKSIHIISLHPGARTAVIVVLAVSLVLTGNTRRVVRELAGPIPNYAQAKAEWNEILRKAATDKRLEVVLPRIANPPDTIGFSDITTNPENWINKCAAQYYGLSSVRVERN